jgi:hypothetical protein
MLNMTWGCIDDENRKLLGNDRWWAEEEVDAGVYH